MLPYSNNRTRTSGSRRKPLPVWKRPGVWFRFIIAIFTVNLFIAIVTVERHISSSLTTIEMDHPRISQPLTQKRSQIGQRRGEFSTESRIWHRLLLQQDPKDRTNQQFLCSNQTIVAETHDGVAPLSPFGFAKSVRAYVREHENRSSTPNNGDSMPPVYCLSPPSVPSCLSTQYTVVIYSSGHVRNHDNSVDTKTKKNSYWRNIVVGTMKFLAYPSVKRVNLVLRDTNVVVHQRKSSLLEDAAKRNKYAQRVLNWNRNGDANILVVSSLWDAIDRLDVPSESVLWIDGDYSLLKTSNDTELNDYFHAWREIPNALAVADETSLASLPLSNGRLPKEKASGDTCSFPLLHEMMLHANYLCYLNHPVVGSELRNYTKTLEKKIIRDFGTSRGYNLDQLSWDITTTAMGMLLFSVGDGYFVKNMDHSSTTAADSISDLSMPLHSAAGDHAALANYIKDLSRYFGCSCSTSIPRLSLPIKRQCSSGFAKDHA